MSRLGSVARRLTALFRRRQFERDLEDELSFHLDMRRAEHHDAGLDDHQARLRALRQFGNRTAIKAQTRAAWSFPSPIGGPAIARLIAFTRNGAVTATVVLALSLGVGLSAAMFNLVDVLLFRPPAHVIDPDRLVQVPSSNNFVRFVRLQRRIQSLDLAVYTRLPVTIGRAPDSSILRAECVSDNYFAVLGVRPSLGRSFSPGQLSAEGLPTVILSHGLWRRLFQGSPEVLGSSVELAGKRHGVVGVAPPRFTGVGLDLVDLWLTVTGSPEVCSFTGRSLLSSSNSAWLSTIGRLRDQVTADQAALEIAALRGGAGETDRARESEVRPLASSRRARLSQDGRMALWLAGGALLVLVIACSNAAVLLALRAWERRLEVAIRIQLGATARRVFVLLFLENVTVTLLCTGSAALVAVWVDAALRVYFPTLPDDRMTLRSFAIIAGFGLTAGLIGAVIPAIQVARSNASLLLRGGHQIVAGGSRMRVALIVVQLALAHVLLVGSGLFVQSVDNLLRGAGYDIRPIIVATIELETQGYSIADAWSKMDTFIERVRTVPAVESVGVSSDTLLNSGGMTVGVAIKSSLRPRFGDTQSMNAVSPDYFATLGTRVLRGRAFVAADDASARPVAIIDEGLARAEWPGQDPLGRCAYIGSRTDCIEIVGISQTRRSTFLRLVRKEFFVPAAQAAPYRLHTAPRTLFIRTRTDVREVMPAIVGVLQSVVPEVPKGSVRPLLDLADEGTKSWRLGAELFRLFGVTAAIMVGIGLYGALALMVRQRAAEMAVRMVLGATPATVIRIIVRHVAVLLVSGCLLGATVVLLLARLVEPLLFEVRATEPSIQTAVTLLLSSIAVCGSMWPALRAARVNPASALH